MGNQDIGIAQMISIVETGLGDPKQIASKKLIPCIETRYQRSRADIVYMNPDTSVRHAFEKIKTHFISPYLINILTTAVVKNQSTTMINRTVVG